MRKALVLLLGVCLVALLIGSVAARDIVDPGKRPMKAWAYDDSNTESVDPGLRDLYEAAAVDTYLIAWYTFDTNDWQGWVKKDNTGQFAVFFHVDDFAGLGTAWLPLEGLKSMWCGARPATNEYMCGWKKAPGYGNNWSQQLVTDPFMFQGTISFTYTIKWDSEPDYDFTFVQYDAGGGNWKELAKYDDVGTETKTVYVYSTQIQTKLRFRFMSDTAWSDEDGLYGSDGACIVDALRIQDIASLNLYENFETYAVGALDCGLWHAKEDITFGDYCGFWNNLADKDPCGDNFGTQIVFFVGSGEVSTSYPGLWDTPFCKGPDRISAPCQDNVIVSPIIDMKKFTTLRNHVQDGVIPSGDLSLLGGAILEFTCFRDLPIPNNVFYYWGLRQIINDCPTIWMDDNYVYYGPDMDYIQNNWDVSKFIGTSDPVQIRVGCIDYCLYWYTPIDNCAQHTPSPWIDNVRLKRYKTSGPQWGSRDIDMFNDNFPMEEFNIESYVRCDNAMDILPAASLGIRPGDSCVVDCTAKLAGALKVDAAGGPSVYIHVKATYVGPAPTKPKLYGPSLAGSVTVTNDPPYIINFRYVSDNGTWTIIQCDTARNANGTVDDRYMVDLNDALFTRGYKIEYYYRAIDSQNKISYYPRYAPTTLRFFEWSCFPTLNSRVLFVDDFTGRGSFLGTVENYWVPVLKTVLAAPGNNIDIYDVNGPSSGVCNGPGSRAKSQHLKDNYDIIIWDSGDLESFTISDGTVDKSNDIQALLDWMKLSSHACGLWVCGDDVAYDLDGSSTIGALSLMSLWCGVDYVATSYFDETGGRAGGGVVNPLLTGDSDAGIFVHTGVPDQFYAYGGCFVINQFDCLEKTGTGKYALRYPAYKGLNYYGAIANQQPNDFEFPVRTMWFGFSFQYVRDNTQSVPQDKFEIANDVLKWMQGVTSINITDAKTPSAYALAQNFPNPFNPSTTIRFDMREKGFVTLKIYNVAGQLVRTLVDGVTDAGSHNVAWNGLNDRGGAVASGIYFYKMETKDFSQTKKMVMLR